MVGIGFRKQKLVGVIVNRKVIHLSIISQPHHRVQYTRSSDHTGVKKRPALTILGWVTFKYFQDTMCGWYIRPDLGEANLSAIPSLCTIRYPSSIVEKLIESLHIEGTKTIN